MKRIIYENVPLILEQREHDFFKKLCILYVKVLTKTRFRWLNVRLSNG